MTTSTSSSTSARTLAAAVATLALLSGCDRPGGAASEAGGGQQGTVAPDAAPASAEPSRAEPALADSPARLYTADLSAAVAGAKKRPFASAASFGGMACSPGAISGDGRALTLTLPESADARRHVLAVVTPERGLLEIYSPYGEETEAEDLTLPSLAITWAKARTERQFATSSDALSGLRRGSDTPEALFIEPGRYRFALVNGINAELLKANRTPMVAYAACSFDWTP